MKRCEARCGRLVGVPYVCLSLSVCMNVCMLYMYVCMYVCICVCSMGIRP